MSRTKQVSAALVILVMALIFCHLRIGTKAGDSISGVDDGAGGKEGLIDSRSTGSRLTVTHPSSEMRSILTLLIPGFFHLDLEKVKRSWEGETPSAEALAATALWTSDAGIWDALRAKVSSNKIAAAAVGLAAPTAVERLEAAKELTHSDPGNGLGFLAAAEASIQLGDRNAALEYLKQAAGAGRFDLYLDSFATQQDRILELSNLDEVQRATLLHHDRWQSKALSVAGVLSRLTDDGGGDGASGETADQMLAVMGQLKDAIGAHSSISATLQLEEKDELILRGMPSDERITDDETSRDRAKQIGIERANLSARSQEIMELLETSTYEISQEYYRRSASDGEISASQWLLGQ